MTDQNRPERQPDTRPDARFADADPDQPLALRAEDADDLAILAALAPVSYTHLTLPTICSV